MAVHENGIGSQNALTALYFRPEVQGVWYNTKEVKLDGFRFISCRFDKCVLTVTSTNFELVNCYIGEDTTVQFGSDIAKPIRLFNLRSQWVYTTMPFFAPTLNPDGTITVKTQ
jgi:hypothetical protein